MTADATWRWSERPSALTDVIMRSNYHPVPEA